jgi:hypothetical protein
VKKIALILLLSVACAPAFAQQQRPDWKGKNQGTSRDDRDRMRQDMRDAYRDRGGDRGSQERPRQMSPQERERLRQDIDDANRRLKR